MLYQHIFLYMYCIFTVYNVFFFTLDLMSLFIFHSSSFSLMNPMSHAPSHTFLNLYINTVFFFVIFVISDAPSFARRSVYCSC